MIVSTTLIGSLAKALKTVVPEASDTDLTIRDLSLVLEAPQPIRIDGLIGNLPQVGYSIVRTNFAWTANAGTTAVEVVRLGPGIWDLTITGFYISNYIGKGPTGSGPDASVRLSNISTAACPIMFFYATGTAAAPVVQSLTAQFKLTIEAENSFRIDVQTDANGAGQAHSLSGQVLANKLL